MTLLGKRPEHHRLFVHHVAEAEGYVVTECYARTVHECRPKPSKPARGERSRTDNHWFDCLVGCAIAASAAGVKAPSYTAAGRQRTRYTHDDLRRTDTWPSL